MSNEFNPKREAKWIACSTCGSNSFIIGKLEAVVSSFKTGKNYRSVLICRECCSIILRHKLQEQNRNGAIKLVLEDVLIEYPYWALDKLRNTLELLSQSAKTSLGINEPTNPQEERKAHY